MDKTTVPPTTNSDRWMALIERARKLDAEAFDEIVDELSPRLYGFVYRLIGRPCDAEEIVQDIFLRIVRTIDRYEHDGRFEPWVFRIASNAVRDRRRRQRRRPPEQAIDGEFDHGQAADGRTDVLVDTAGFSPGSAMSLAEDVDRLNQALCRLPEGEREVILLRHYSGMSYEEIAALMETPLGTALARAHRGLKKLRGWMESPA